MDLKISEMLIHLNFIDEYIDILKYKTPVTKYSYRIENKYDKYYYSINHLNFNPAEIISNIGYILDKEKVELSFFFERNDVLTYEKTNGIYMGYTFYLNNRIKYYERSYKTIPDALSTVGGTLNIVIFIMTLINDSFNSFMVLQNFNWLLNLFSITAEDIELANKKNILSKKLRQVETIKKLSCLFTSKETKENIMKEEEKEREEDKEAMPEQTLNSERNEKDQEINRFQI